MKKVLVTGAAGFIGSYLSIKLANNGFKVIGIDNLNDYYDVRLKLERLKFINNSVESEDDFNFFKLDLVNKEELDNLFKVEKFDYVVNLAAQAGVRYSIEKPYSYIDSNIVGFINVLEACRRFPVEHLLYASSSSVYGNNSKVPFSVNDPVDHPVSLYAATKKSNELLAHSYSSLYDIPTTGLRFFTVYGPYGRPDMAYFSFSNKIKNNETIQIFNNGKMERDFTYIDDIVESVYRLIEKPPVKNDKWSVDQGIGQSFAPYRVLNIGNGKPVPLLYFIEVLEKNLGIESTKQYLPMQMGDVKKTYADTSTLKELISFTPQITIEEGIKRFTDWYKEFI